MNKKQNMPQKHDKYGNPIFDKKGNPVPANKKPWWISLIIGVITIGILGAVFGDSNKDDKKAETSKPVEETVKESTTVKEETTKTEKETESEEKEFVSVGESIEQKNVIVTFVSVDESTGSDFNKPDDDKVFVLPLFEIENNSNKDLAISSMLSFDAYIDGYSESISLKALLEADGQLDGKVASGKKLKGVYGLEAPADWEEIEIIFKPTLLGKEIKFKHVR